MDTTMGSSNPSATSKKAIGQLNTLTITDNNGNTQNLSFGTVKNGTFSTSEFELPPPAPEGTFDVRFASNQCIELTPDNLTGTLSYGITISSSAYPVTVRWHITGDFQNRYLLKAASGSKSSLAGDGVITLSAPDKSLALQVTPPDVLPKEFSLSSNYPNPFNPSTSIRVGLPVQSNVSLRIYNVIGQEVAVIASGIYGQGYHDFTWAGTTGAGLQVGSGIYFYKIDAVPVEEGRSGFTAIHKMALIK